MLGDAACVFLWLSMHQPLTGPCLSLQPPCNSIHSQDLGPPVTALLSSLPCVCSKCPQLVSSVREPCLLSLAIPPRPSFSESVCSRRSLTWSEWEADGTRQLSLPRVPNFVVLSGLGNRARKKCSFLGGSIPRLQWKGRHWMALASGKTSKAPPLESSLWVPHAMCTHYPWFR